MWPGCYKLLYCASISQLHLWCGGYSSTGVALTSTDTSHNHLSANVRKDSVHTMQ